MFQEGLGRFGDTLGETPVGSVLNMLVMSFPIPIHVYVYIYIYIYIIVLARLQQHKVSAVHGIGSFFLIQMFRCFCYIFVASETHHAIPKGLAAITEVLRPCSGIIEPAEIEPGFDTEIVIFFMTTWKPSFSL